MTEFKALYAGTEKMRGLIAGANRGWELSQAHGSVSELWAHLGKNPAELASLDAILIEESLFEGDERKKFASFVTTMAPFVFVGLIGNGRGNDEIAAAVDAETERLGAWSSFDYYFVSEKDLRAGLSNAVSSMGSSKVS